MGPGETGGTSPQLLIQETSASLAAIALPAETAALFVGYTPGGAAHLLEPVGIDSMQQYVDTFGEENSGDTSTVHFPLYFHLELYFHNGGRRCWIVSTGNDSTKKSLGGNEGNLPGLLDGLRVAKMVDEANLLCIPEATELMTPDYTMLVQAMLAHCASMPNCFALIDVQEGTIFNPSSLAVFNTITGTDHLLYGAAYFPFLETTFNIGTSGNFLVLPSSAAIAGVIAGTDRDKGIWKAPANVVLKNVRQPAVLLSQQQQEQIAGGLPGNSYINVIRSFAGDTKVWGARTLETNNTERKYISVQRMLMTVSKAVSDALQPYVFEANDAGSWKRIRSAIENYLLYYWKAGALQGMKIDEAFFVHAGLGQTMTQADVDSGKMIVEIGMAITRPAEFILLRFSQQVRI